MLPRRSIRRWTWPVVVAAMGLGFALVPLAQGKFFFCWDNAQQHYPQTVFLHRALRSGEIPQWWAGVGLGFPVTGEGQAAHYDPIRLVLAGIFSPPVAFMLEIGLCLAIAGLSTYFFLRQFRLLKPACFLGAMCQMFGGYSLIAVNNVALHRSLCLLPLAMLLAERFVSQRRLLNGVCAGLVVGLQLLTGHPTFALVTIVATTFYILCRIFQRSWRTQESVPRLATQLGRAVGQWGLVVAQGFSIAAIQVLPTLLSAQESFRQGGLSFEYASRALAATVTGMLQLLFPYAYVQGDWLRTPTPGGSYFNVVPHTGIYAGALPLLLVSLGLWWKRRWPDPTGPFLACFLFAVGLSLGAQTPLFPALWSLPGMNGFRYPQRFLMLGSFSLACLAALGVHRLIARSRLRHLRPRDLLPFFAVTAIVLMFGWLFWTRRVEFRSGILISLALFAVAVAFAASLLVLRKRPQRMLVSLAVLFALADLLMFRTWSGYALTLPFAKSTEPPPVVERLKTDPDRFRVMSLLYYEEGLNQNGDLREFLQADLCTIWGIDSMDASMSLLPKRYHAVREGIVWELRNSPDSAEKLKGYLGALNVKYVIAPRPVSLPGWVKVYETERACTWRNPSFLPRAYLVGQVEPEDTKVRADWIDGSERRLPKYRRMVRDWGSRLGDVQIVDQILSRSFNFRTTAVVEGSELPALSGLDPQAEVRVLPAKSDTMKFEVQSGKPALLVIASSYYPGWTARINGQPARIYRTNWLTMGVLVPPGKNEIVLDFVTPGFRLGLVVTTLSLAILLAGLVTRGQHRGE